MEIRILAHICRDQNLIQVLTEGKTQATKHSPSILQQKNLGQRMPMQPPAATASGSGSGTTTPGTVCATNATVEGVALSTGGDVYELMARRMFNLSEAVPKEQRDQAKSLSLGSAHTHTHALA